MVIFEIFKLLLLRILMKKTLIIFCGFILLLLLIYALGPEPDFKEVDPSLPELDLDITQVESYLGEKDLEIKDLKPGTESYLIWNDTLLKNKTEYVVVYLHGFSASGEEGGDVHVPFAAHFGANLLVPRLYDSGRKSIDTYKDLTPTQMMNAAKEAVALGKLLGDKIILMSCSTGGTYSAYLAAHHPEIHSLFMYSPNIDLHDKMSNAILHPWGPSILRFIQGSEYYVIDHYNEEQKKYWNEKYHTDGIIALKYLIHQSMRKEVFQKITQPTFISYYFKNEEEKDLVVSTDKIVDFYNMISTPPHSKRLHSCGDCMNHVISSRLMNKNVDQVLKESIRFAEDVLQLKPIYTDVLED